MRLAALHKEKLHREKEQKRAAMDNALSTLSLHGTLLVSKHANQIVVERCCRRSLLSGVRPQMSLALAKALMPQAKVALYEPQRDFDVLKKLGTKLLSTTPLVAIDTVLMQAAKDGDLIGVDPLFIGLVLDMTGTERFYASSSLNDKKIVAHLLKRFFSVLIEARIAIAPTIGAAWALSRFGSNNPIILGSNASRTEIKDLLSPLPVKALRVSAETCLALKQIGIEQIGQLLSLPKRSLGLRFGIELVRRIDQALGATTEPLSMVEERKEVFYRQEFESPLTKHQEITIATLNALQQILLKLAPKKEKPLSLLLGFESFGVAPETVTREIALLSATQNQSQLQTIVIPIVEKIRFREGLRVVSIRVLHSERAKEKQVPFIKSEQHSAHEFSLDEEQRGALLNTLVTRFKKSAVNTVSFNSSYLPERSFSFQSAGQQKEYEPPPPLLRERPPYLLYPAEEVQAIAMLPDKPPSWIQWRDEKLMLHRGIGPERIAAEWWRGSLQEQEGERDYFRVQDECGRWLWVYRDRGTLRWFVQGVWV